VDGQHVIAEGTLLLVTDPVGYRLAITAPRLAR